MKLKEFDMEPYDAVAFSSSDLEGFIHMKINNTRLMLSESEKELLSHNIINYQYFEHAAILYID